MWRWCVLLALPVFSGEGTDCIDWDIKFGGYIACRQYIDDRPPFPAATRACALACWMRVHKRAGSTCIRKIGGKDFPTQMEPKSEQPKPKLPQKEAML
eukprot:scaffold19515_cov31-Tisochrysis_lutea.AAC.2